MIYWLDLKNTWSNLLDSDLFYYNQAEMLTACSYDTYLFQRESTLNSCLHDKELLA